MRPDYPRHSRIISRDTGPLPRQWLTTNRFHEKIVLQDFGSQFGCSFSPPLFLEKQPTEGAFFLLLVQWGIRKGQHDLEADIRLFLELSYKYKIPISDDVRFVVRDSNPLVGYIKLSRLVDSVR